MKRELHSISHFCSTESNCNHEILKEYKGIPHQTPKISSVYDSYEKHLVVAFQEVVRLALKHPPPPLPPPL